MPNGFNFCYILYSCNQHGSRFIQQKLDTVSLEEKAMVFQEVLPHALTLMKDVFGNYVIQKVIVHVFEGVLAACILYCASYFICIGIVQERIEELFALVDRKKQPPLRRQISFTSLDQGCVTKIREHLWIQSC